MLPLHHRPIWWTNKDLNLEPSVYETDALTFVLLVHVVPPVGNAPTPSGFSDPRSDFISYRGIWSEGLDSNQRCFCVRVLQTPTLAAR